MAALPNITLLGAGNVGTHLARALHQAGYTIRQIYSRRPQSLAPLSHFCQIGTSTRLEELLPDSDLYLIAVADDAIASVAAQLRVASTAIVAHTSGSVPATALIPHLRRGIFYPLQTFSAQKAIEWAHIPIIIQANDTAAEQLLRQTATTLSSKVYELTDEQRQLVHLGAVVVNNFTNYLISLAYDWLQQHQLPFDLLQPLILETAQKVQTQNPHHAQTGPARRGDHATIERHLSLLQHNPDLRDLYSQLSHLIMQQNKVL